MDAIESHARLMFLGVDCARSLRVYELSYLVIIDCSCSCAH